MQFNMHIHFICLQCDSSDKIKFPVVAAIVLYGLAIS